MEEIDPGLSPEDCYQLLKGIYGLCQAARQFWKKFMSIIKQESFEFQVSPADPWMLFKVQNCSKVNQKIIFTSQRIISS